MTGRQFFSRLCPSSFTGRYGTAAQQAAIACAAFALAMAAAASDRPVVRAALAEGVFELDNYRGIDGCLMLSNNDMEVILAGNYTRRVMSIRTSNTENLARVERFRNDGAPRDFTTWLPLDGLRIDAFGPNGERQSPALVHHHHELISTAPRSITFRSRVDEDLAGQIEQIFTIDEKENVLYWKVAIKNLAGESRTWSVWYRNEIRADNSFLVLPVEESPETLIDGLGTGDTDDAARNAYMSGLFDTILYRGEGMVAFAPGRYNVMGHGIASRSRAGWAAAVKGRSALSVAWPKQDRAEYIMNAPFASWLTQNSLSLEVESPRTAIEPGATLEFQTEWRVSELRKPVESFEDVQEAFPHVEAAALRLPPPGRGLFRVAVGSSADKSDAVAAVREAFAEARAGLDGMAPHTFYFIDGMRFKRFQNIEAAYEMLEELAGDARLIGVDTASYQALSHSDFMETGFAVAAFAGDIGVDCFYVTGLELRAEDEKSMTRFERELHQNMRIAAHREKGRELARKVKVPVNEPYFMLWSSTTHTPRHYWVYAGFLDVMGLDAPCAGGGLMCSGRIYADGRFHADAAMVLVLSGDFDYGVHGAATVEKGGIGEKTLENLDAAIVQMGGNEPDFVVAYFCASWSDQYNEKGSNIASREAMAGRLPGVPVFGRYCAGEVGQVINSGPNFGDAGLSFILCVRQCGAGQAGTP